LWAKLDERYFARFDAADLAWQARMLWRHVTTPTPLVRARLSPVGEGIQVLVYAPDRGDLFLRISGFFARIQYTIVEAKIHTTQHGYALDSFQVMDLAHRGIHYRDFLSYVEYELARDLDPARPVERVARGRLSRQQKHHPYPPHVRLDLHGEHATVLVRCADRGGLLFAIADVLARHGLALDAAKIDTLGERVEDAFSVSGKALADPEQRAVIEAELLAAASV
jgi:[protein-PII] uridylyltransferase